MPLRSSSTRRWTSRPACLRLLRLRRICALRVCIIVHQRVVVTLRAVERVDTKVASIGEESARFERSIRHITVPGTRTHLFVVLHPLLSWCSRAGRRC